MKVRWTSTENTVHEVGWEIDHPDAFRLVQLGWAEPIDAEARAKAAEHEAYLQKVRARLLADAQKLVADEQDKRAEIEKLRRADFEARLLEKP